MNLLEDSFLVSYLVLLGYTTITLIEAIRTPFTNVRHVMNIETTVSIVAAIVYGFFYEEVKTGRYNLKNFTRIRYFDWMITTPLIILGLLLFYNQKLDQVPYEIYATIVLLDWAMLYSGYIGEEGIVSKWTGVGVGFLFLAALLGIIYTRCIPAGSNFTAFYIFAVLWSLYGVAYLQDEETKNISYNILDLFSKGLFGVGIWMFFGKVLKF